MTSEISSYKGNPIISLHLDNEGKFKFSFGLTKAVAILDNLEAIKKFVMDNKKEG